MISQYAQQLFLLAILATMTSAIVEVIKQFLISLPDSIFGIKLGPAFSTGLNKKAVRWLSFIISYLIAWVFNFKFASIIFKSINNTKADLAQHLDYFIVACLIFMGAKWIYKNIMKFQNEITGK